MVTKIPEQKHLQKPGAWSLISFWLMGRGASIVMKRIRHPFHPSPPMDWPLRPVLSVWLYPDQCTQNIKG